MSWIAGVIREVSEHGAVVRATVVRADGSTPREVGAAMLVGADHIVDTIGGGALELEAIVHARGLLPEPAVASGGEIWRRDERDFALGPSLGQCCGGSTRLLFEVFTASERPYLEALARIGGPESTLVLRPLDGGRPPEAASSPKTQGDWPLAVTRVVRDMLLDARSREPCLIRVGKGEGMWFLEPLARRVVPLYIYGAGHVGRALVRVLRDLPFTITWADIAASRFPDPMPAHVRAQATANLPALAAAAPVGAYHIVMTCSHALDLAICLALLRQCDCAHLGLIGSATKRRRFLKRLAELGIAPALLSRLTCPIGLPGLGGKEPAVIAVSVAAQLVQLAAADRQRLGSALSGAQDGRR